MPNEPLAQQAETELETLEEMFFAACLLDYEAAAAQWREQAARLQGADRVRIVAGAETDLEFSVAGRQWRVFDGKINLPDGEIYTAPVNNSLNGKIHFELPCVFGGVPVHDIRLEWRGGELINASASSNADYLWRVLETDGGSSRLGEFAFGMNPSINRFCKDILYDEKIAGTIHLALGRAYRRMRRRESVEHPLGPGQGSARGRRCNHRWEAGHARGPVTYLKWKRGGRYRAINVSCAIDQFRSKELIVSK